VTVGRDGTVQTHSLTSAKIALLLRLARIREMKDIAAKAANKPIRM